MSLGLYLPLISIVLLIPLVSFSQERTCQYPELIPFCIFPKPFRLSNVSGLVLDEDGVEIPDSCVTLFRGKSHERVISATTNDRGRFALRKVPDGTYVLVVGYAGFTPAIATIVIDHKARSFESLRVQMVLSGIDTCSEVDLRKKKT